MRRSGGNTPSAPLETRFSSQRFFMCSTRCRLLLGLAILLLYQANAFAQHAPQVVVHELELAKRFGGLTDEQAEAIVLELKPIIREEYEKTREADLDFHDLEAALIRHAQQAIKNTLDDRQKFRRYKDELEKRRQAQREAVAKSFVLRVDDWVGLPSDQWAAVESLGGRLYDESIVNDPFSLIYLLELEAKDHVGKYDLASVLSEQQFVCYRERVNLEPAWFTAQSVRETSREEREEQLTKMLYHVGHTRIDLLDAELQLSDSQRAKLEVALKGYAAPLVEKKLDAEYEYREWLDAIDQGVVLTITTEEVQDLAKDYAGSLFYLEHPTWAQHVEKVLSEQQREVWKTITDARLADVRFVAGYSVTEILTKGMVLSTEEHANFRKLISERLNIKAGVMKAVWSPDRSHALVDIPADDFIQIVGNENWDRKLRERIENIRKNRERARQERQSD